MEIIFWSAAFLALCGSALCSASETAFFSLTAFERKKLLKHPLKAKHIAYCLGHLSEMLVLILFLNIVNNIAFAFLIQKSLAYRFESGALLLGSVVFLSTLLLVFFGEIIPKNIAFERRLRLSPLFAGFWHLTHSLLRPLLPALILVSDRLKRGLMHVFAPQSDVDKEYEVTNLLALARRRGSLNRVERSLIQNISELHLLNAKDVMVPRVNVAMLDTDLEQEECLREIRNARRRWLPVYSGTIDNITGILKAEDYLLHGGAMKDHMMQPLFVPETARFFNLFTQFKTHQLPLVLVVDEYGGFTGMITFTDFMEEITGDLNSDWKGGEGEPVYLGRGVYLVPGDAHLFEVGDLFRVDLGTFTSDTLNGLIQEVTGNFPQLGMVYRVEGLKIMAVKVSRKQMVLAKVWKDKTP